MLTFNLKKQWYDKIASGEKRIEYREVKPYWMRRFVNAYIALTHKPLPEHFKEGGFNYMSADIPCILRLGYTKRYMTAKITKVEVVDGKDTDLKIDKPVYAIHFAEVSEED